MVILFITLLLPLLSFLVLQTFGKFIGNTKIGILATALVALSAFCALWLLFFGLSSNIPFRIVWIQLSGTSIDFSFKTDRFALLMLWIVNSISALVHLFSMSYMKKDPHFLRYFSHLGLFTFAMNQLIVSENLIQFYIFWELIGFSSYLLIGFWRTKPAAAAAAKKAFLVNRLGDVGFLCAIMAIYTTFGTADISEIRMLLADLAYPPPALQLIGFGFLLALMAKSAQLPLSLWLPDAMEGPTPVSALIHAATMVAAGIYLGIATHFLLSPFILQLALWIGLLTALFAAWAAVSQTNIKKLLAYSTLSQLGFMLVALALGNPEAAFFHLFTHAFFKALLFLAAGTLIYALHRTKKPQNLQTMAGVAKKLPFVRLSLLFGGAALIGLPLSSGFLSKELILTQAFSRPFVFTILLLAILLTALYTTKLLLKTIWQPQNKESISLFIFPDLKMRLPLLLLSVACLWFWYAPNPWQVASNQAVISHSSAHIFVPLLALFFSFLGMLIALFVYRSAREKKPLQGYLSFVFYRTDRFFLMLDDFISEKIPRFILQISAYLLLIEQKIFNQTADRVGKIACMLAGKLYYSDLVCFNKPVNLLGKGAVVFGSFTHWADKYLIDGLVTLFSQSLYKTGIAMKKSQAKPLQNLLILSLLLLIFFVFGFCYLFLDF